jgi:hypothetical protein
MMGVYVLPSYKDNILLDEFQDFREWTDESVR